jgi:hypothetical protein
LSGGKSGRRADGAQRRYSRGSNVDAASNVDERNSGPGRDRGRGKDGDACEDDDREDDDCDHDGERCDDTRGALGSGGRRSEARGEAAGSDDEEIVAQPGPPTRSPPPTPPLPQRGLAAASPGSGAARPPACPSMVAMAGMPAAGAALGSGVVRFGPARGAAGGGALDRRRLDGLAALSSAILSSDSESD